MYRYSAEGTEVGMGMGPNPPDFMCSWLVTHNSHEDNTHQMACFAQYVILNAGTETRTFWTRLCWNSDPISPQPQEIRYHRT